MAKTADFHGRISAGIDCKHKMVIHVFTEWALWGLERGAVVPLSVLSPPRRQAEQQTSSANSKNQSSISTATPSRTKNSRR